MDKILKIKQLLGLPELSQSKIRSFLKSVHRPLPGQRVPHQVETIALVIPCYNHAPHLGTMMESVRCQTRLPDEIILVNDASPDDTGERLSLLAAAEGSGRVRVMENERNIGQSASLNKAVAEVESDAVMILNDDDYLFHDAVEVVMELFNLHREVRLFGASSVHFDSDALLAAHGKLIKAHCPPGQLVLSHALPQDVRLYRKFDDLNMTHSGMAFLKSAWAAVGGYNPQKGKRVVPFSDRDFQLRVNALFPVAVSREVPFAFWRNNSSVDRGIDS